MPINQWPYVPDRLTDVLPEELVQFFQCGCSVRLKTPVAIVELRDEDGKEMTHWISAIDKWINFSPFCEYLRGPKEEEKPRNFIGADETCKRYDAEKAFSFLKKKTQSDISDGYAYRCHMGMWDFIAPIRVAGKRVACLFGGQKRPIETEHRSFLDYQVKRIGEGNNDDIKQGEGSCNGLMERVEKNRPYEEGFLDQLRTEAVQIASFAEDRRKLLKISKEDEFLRSLDMEPSDRRENLDSGLEGILKKIIDWVPFTFLCVLVCEETGQQELKKTIHAGTPPPSIENVVFDWGALKKTNPPEDGPSLPDQQKAKQGFRGESAPAFAERVKYAVPVEVTGGYRAVVCFGSLACVEPLQKESNFLDRLANKAVARYLESLHGVLLSEKQEEWEDAVALISHQVRASLQPITSEADMVSEYLENGEEGWVSHTRAQEAINTLQEEAKALAQYTFETFDFWRWIRGRKTISFTIQKPYEIASGCVRRLKPFALEDKIDIYIHESVRRLPDTEMIKNTMSVAVFNVIENAIKYSFSERYINISGKVVKEDRWIEISIEDYGIGIPDEEKERIFRKRARGKHLGRKTRRQGEGLGLWQAKEILKAHGGDITCESRSGDRQAKPGEVEGFRTIFTLSLPIKQEYREEKS